MMEQECCMTRSDRPSKRQRLEELAKKKDASLMLPSDLLHTIFSFFVSDSGVVDGCSLRSCSAVNRRWHSMAQSRALWSIATMNYRKQSSVPAIQPSLNIKDVSQGENDDGDVDTKSTLSDTLVGFTKLQTIQTASESSNGSCMYRVMERSTGHKCILSIANEPKIHPLFLAEISFEHFRMGGKCFLHPIVATDKPKKNGPCFVLRGIALHKGRLLWWHDDLTSSGCEGTSSPLICQRNKYKSCGLAYESRAHKLMLFEGTNEQTIGGTDNIQSEHRAEIVDWVMEVVECLGADKQTPFQAMMLFDRFLAASTEPVQPKRYQLLSAACLQIASKCSDRPIFCSDMSHCADNSFDSAILNRAELLVLRTLKWKIGNPTILDFLHAYLRELDDEVPRLLGSFMTYLAELALQSSAAMLYRPSVTAACVVILGRYFTMQKEQLWPEVLETATGYTFDELEGCAKNMSRILWMMDASMPWLRIIHRRNSKIGRASVGSFSVPVVESFEDPFEYTGDNDSLWVR